MSGGSFDYLYCRPLGEAVESSNFDRMADALAEYQTGQRAALEFRSILSAFDALTTRWLALEGVMRGSTGAIPNGALVRMACARLPAAIKAFEGTQP